MSQGSYLQILVWKCSLVFKIYFSLHWGTNIWPLTPSEGDSWSDHDKTKRTIPRTICLCATVSTIKYGTRSQIELNFRFVQSLLWSEINTLKKIDCADALLTMVQKRMVKESGWYLLPFRSYAGWTKKSDSSYYEYDYDAEPDEKCYFWSTNITDSVLGAKNKCINGIFKIEFYILVQNIGQKCPLAGEIWP